MINNLISYKPYPKDRACSLLLGRRAGDEAKIITNLNFKSVIMKQVRLEKSKSPKREKGNLRSPFLQFLVMMSAWTMHVSVGYFFYGGIS